MGKIEELFVGYPVRISLPVQWGDQDAVGHVNNVIYFRWQESARVAYFRTIEFHAGMAGKKVGPILASSTVNFREQMTFPDTVHVGSRVAKIGGSSMTLEHLFVSESKGKVVADGQAVIVAFDYVEQKVVRVPDEVRQVIAKLEQKSVG